MKDKTEERLLKGCGIYLKIDFNGKLEKFNCGKHFVNGKRVYCGDCLTKLQQHRETKEEILDKIIKMRKARGDGIIAVANHTLVTEGIEAYKVEVEKEYIEPEELKKEIKK